MGREEIARTQWGSREKTASRDVSGVGLSLSSHWDVLNELFDQLSGEARNDQKFLMGVSETSAGVPTRNRELRSLDRFTPRDRTNKPVPWERGQVGAKSFPY